MKISTKSPPSDCQNNSGLKQYLALWDVGKWVLSWTIGENVHFCMGALETRLTASGGGNGLRLHSRPFPPGRAHQWFLTGWCFRPSGNIWQPWRHFRLLCFLFIPTQKYVPFLLLCCLVWCICDAYLGLLLRSSGFHPQHLVCAAWVLVFAWSSIPKPLETSV